MFKQVTSRAKDYWQLLRFDKPIGILLLLWPTMSALWLASDGHPRADLVAIFILGTVIMRAAGCVINDIADRDFDRHVTRTQARPLTAKRITVNDALVLGGIFFGAAFILAMQLNRMAFQLAFIGAAVAVLYPFTKRWWSAPQAVLGIAFAWGVPMAFAATTSALPLSCWLLFLSTMAWTVAYDTQYAMVDRDDDLKIGVHSTAIWFGAYDVMMVAGLHGLMMILLLILGFLEHLNGLFFGGLLLTSILLFNQHLMIRTREREGCFAAFLSNHWVGLMVFLSILCGQLV